MIQKNYLTLDNEFIKYCELNSIENPEQYAEEVFKRGFNIVKYGNTPFGFDTSEKIVEKEVIKEIIKEIPVENYNSYSQEGNEMLTIPIDFAQSLRPVNINFVNREDIKKKLNNAFSK